MIRGSDDDVDEVDNDEVADNIEDDTDDDNNHSARWKSLTTMTSTITETRIRIFLTLLYLQ